MSTNTNPMEGFSFDLPKNKSNVIKVIGIGGGGGNAVNHMHVEGIKGVDYVICNTDAQALENSPVTNKIQLGVSLTEGLGAGANPEVGEKAAEESLEQIRKMLETNTKMVFITAGMGGGTGTGAAPVIAKLAKDMGILTVGIVTSPFAYEGKKRSDQAQAGIEKLRKNVDSLIVINNNKLAEIYGDLGIKESYAKADEILLKGAKGMAEVISKHYIINIDLHDARTVLENGGTAIMGSAIADGENRAADAIMGALNSPLLNDNRIVGAKNALLLIVFGKKQASQREVEEINNYIQMQAGENMTDIIMGIGEDESLGDALSVTVIATGFDADQQHKIVNTDPKKIIHTLDEEQVAMHDLTTRSPYQQTVMGLDFDMPRFENREEATPTQQPQVSFESNPAAQKVESKRFSPQQEALFNIGVQYELVRVENQEFHIIDKPSEPEVKPTVVKQPQTIKSTVQQSSNTETIYKEPEKPQTVVFNLVEEKTTIPTPKKELSIPQPEINQNGQIVHSLEDYMEFEEKLSKADINTNSIIKENELYQEQKESDISFEVKIDENGQTRIFDDVEKETIDPMNSTISEVLRTRTRPNVLKTYNHKFNISGQSEFEEKKPSRMSFGVDSSGEIQIRTNNSYLHDNVD
ncbi:cell division protein FtsZ [Capnocytophaga canimorsus]|uniref:cell division protein FtsZ n=1 Tax=Capnocytophaga canimorsus TaxID=28188 RepID=UPI0037D19D2C